MEICLTSGVETNRTGSATMYSNLTRQPVNPFIRSAYNNKPVYETLSREQVSGITDLTQLQNAILGIQNELESLRSNIDSVSSSQSSVSGSRVSTTNQRTSSNSIRFTTRFSGDGGAATPIDLAQQNAGTGDVMTYNGTIWTPSSLVPGGLSSQNVSNGSVGAPSIYFGGNATSGFYSPSANQVAITISGVQAANVTSAGIQLFKNVTLGVDNTSQHILNTVTASTVGATGVAEALPSNPLGYVQITINGVNCKIPYYTA